MLTKKEKSITLIHGFFGEAAFDFMNEGREKDIFVLEGRPHLKSSRSVCQALQKRGLKPTLIADNMAGFLFYKNLVKEVYLTYQKSDSQGIFAPVGSLILAVCAKKHKVPVYAFPSNEDLPFLGKSKDVTSFSGIRVAPPAVKGYVPLIERVPKRYIKKVNPAFAVV